MRFDLRYIAYTLIVTAFVALLGLVPFLYDWKPLYFVATFTVIFGFLLLCLNKRNRTDRQKFMQEIDEDDWTEVWEKSELLEKLTIDYFIITKDHRLLKVLDYDDGGSVALSLVAGKGTREERINVYPLDFKSIRFIYNIDEFVTEIGDRCKYECLDTLFLKSKHAGQEKVREDLINLSYVREDIGKIEKVSRIFATIEESQQKRSGGEGV